MSQVTVATEQERQQNSSLFSRNISALALSSAIRAMGGFIGVYLPLYFVQIGGDPFTLGMLTFAASLVQLVFLPIGGFIADNHGRRKIMVTAALLGAVFPFLYAVAQDWRVFGLITVFAAIGAISNPATRATVVDSIPPEKRTTGIAALQVVSTLPSIISPSIGGWIILKYGLEDGFKVACIYGAVFALISIIPLFAMLKETLHPKDAQKDRSPSRNSILSFEKPSFLGLPQSLKALMASYALVVFANGAVSQYYILYASNVVGLTAFDWGAVVSLQILVASVVRIPGGWLSDKFGKKRAMAFSLLLTIPMILIFTMSQSLTQVVVSALLLVAAGIYYAPAHEALQADLTPRPVRGRVNALWDMSSFLAVGLGALAGGFAYQTFGPAVPFYIFATTELAAAALLISKVKEPEIKEA